MDRKVNWNIPSSDLGRDVVYEVADKLDVVTRHDHLFVAVRGTLREEEADGDISSTNVDLWPVVLHERCVTTTLVLRQDLASDSQPVM